MSVDPPADDEIRTFLGAVLDPAKQPMFVHCAEGRDRSGVMCPVDRIEVDGRTPQRAYEEMRSFGWHDELHVALGEFVQGYWRKGLAEADPR